MVLIVKLTSSRSSLHLSCWIALNWLLLPIILITWPPRSLVWLPRTEVRLTISILVDWSSHVKWLAIRWWRSIYIVWASWNWLVGWLNTVYNNSCIRLLGWCVLRGRNNNSRLRNQDCSSSPSTNNSNDATNKAYSKNSWTNNCLRWNRIIITFITIRIKTLFYTIGIFAAPQITITIRIITACITPSSCT